MVRAAAFKALIVEGTHGIGKSTLIDALIRKYVSSSGERKIRSLVHLAQSHTYGPLARGEDDGTLTVEQNLRHLESIFAGLEWLATSVGEHSSTRCVAVIDTLHLTHCFRPGIVQWTDVRAIDARLAAIGCKVLFLEGSRETLWARSIEASAQSQFLSEYARKFGATDEQLHEYFVREQAGLADLFERSAMPKVKLANDGWGTAVNGSYEFWMS